MLVQKPVTPAPDPQKAAGKNSERVTQGGKKQGSAPALLFQDILSSRISARAGKKVFNSPYAKSGSLKLGPEKTGKPASGHGTPEALLSAGARKTFPETEELTGKVKKKEPCEDREALRLAGLENTQANTAKNATTILSDRKNQENAAAGMLRADSTAGKGKNAGLKHQGRERKEPAVTVIDLRTGKETPGPSVRLTEAGGADGGTGNRSDGGDSVIFIKADGNNASQGSGTQQANGQTDFAGRFDGLLKNDLGKEIVRQTGIVVKDDGKGEIRLVLQPERLGKVRIRLDMDDNHVAARILVENNSIRQVFEQNIDHLARMFREGGFMADSLDVFVQGDGSETGSHERRGGVPGKLAGEMEAMVPFVEDEIREETTVNMVV